MTAREDRPAPWWLGWLGDFAWADGKVLVRKTGHLARLDHFFYAEVASWLLWLPVLGAAHLIARLRRRPPVSLWFTPEKPRPWYMLRAVALWAGFTMAGSESQAAAAVYFDDVTKGAPPRTLLAKRINFACTDVSKSHVAAVFAEVFGYPLALDPAAAAGPIVEKSERNGVHDGRVVEAPCAARSGYVYQRLIDSADGSGLSYDLRTVCVGGAPVVVWVKEKPAGERFAIHNRIARLRDPRAVFSAEELALIVRFNARMGLDWGGLDILRDRADGRIYIVDVNKTDLGPVIALSRRDKIASMNRLARALEAMVT